MTRRCVVQVQSGWLDRTGEWGFTDQETGNIDTWGEYVFPSKQKARKFLRLARPKWKLGHVAFTLWEAVPEQERLLGHGCRMDDTDNLYEPGAPDECVRPDPDVPDIPARIIDGYQWELSQLACEIGAENVTGC